MLKIIPLSSLCSSLSRCFGPLAWVRKFLSVPASSFVTSSFLAPKKERAKTLFADSVQKRTGWVWLVVRFPSPDLNLAQPLRWKRLRLVISRLTSFPLRPGCEFDEVGGNLGMANDAPFPPAPSPQLYPIHVTRRAALRRQTEKFPQEVEDNERIARSLEPNNDIVRCSKYVYDGQRHI